MGLKLKLAVILASLPLILYLWPSFLGGDTEFVAVNGISMLPTILSGSLAIEKKSATYEIGDIAVYDSDALGKTIIHRIIAQQSDGFIFKGDNNRSEDPGTITQDKIHGKVILVIPYIGVIPQLFKNPSIMAMAIIMSVAATFGKKGKKGKKGNKNTNRSFLPVAILINLASYVIAEISISSGTIPKMDGLTNYLFQIFEPYIASTLSFACWFFVIIGIYFLTKYYEARQAKRIEYAGKNIIQIKEQNSMAFAGEAFYILLSIVQVLSLIGVVKSLLEIGSPIL
jgi:signal peptidase I